MNKQDFDFYFNNCGVSVQDRLEQRKFELTLKSSIPLFEVPFSKENPFPYIGEKVNILLGKYW